MKFNLEKMPPNLKMSLKVGNVFGARGGCRKDSPPSREARRSDVSNPVVTRIEKTNTEFQITLPSGNVMAVTMYWDAPKQDIAFVERILNIACEETRKESEAK